jgi:hypothetical protein
MKVSFTVTFTLRKGVPCKFCPDKRLLRVCVTTRDGKAGRYLINFDTMIVGTSSMQQVVEADRAM